MQEFGDDADRENHRDVLPALATVMDVKEMNVLDFYTFYLDIKESEDVIKNYFKKTVIGSVGGKRPEATDEDADTCVLCYNSNANKLFRCKVLRTVS